MYKPNKNKVNKKNNNKNISISPELRDFSRYNTNEILPSHPGFYAEAMKLIHTKQKDNKMLSQTNPRFSFSFIHWVDRAIL